MSPWTFKAHLEGLWLLGSLLAGASLITGNAASWSLAEQSKAWFYLMGRGLFPCGWQSARVAITPESALSGHCSMRAKIIRLPSAGMYRLRVMPTIPATT